MTQYNADNKKSGHFIEPVTSTSLGRLKPYYSGGGDLEWSHLIEWIELQKIEKEQKGFEIVKIKIMPSPTWLDRWSYELEYVKAPPIDKRKDQKKAREEMGLPT